jgi:photosystem II stability/assembly factor-like uncharacterized protein
MKSTDAGMSWRNALPYDTHYDFPCIGANSSGVYLLPAMSGSTKQEFMDSSSTFLLHFDPVTGDTDYVRVPVLCRKKYSDYLPREISVASDAIFMLQNSSSSIAGNMALLGSTDNGRSWERLRLPDSAMRFTADISFRDARHGVLTSSLPDSANVQAVYLTANAGATWERVYGFYHPGYSLCPSIQFVDDTTIIVLGDDGALHITRDYGSNWSMSSAVPFSISTFHFLPDGSGYVSGGDRQVAKTTDFGASWIHIKSGVWSGAGGRMSVIALDPNVLVYFDPTGTAFTTKNGGLSWDYAFIQQIIDIPNFWFFSRSNGIMYVPWNGYSANPWSEYHGTTDGGESWSLLFNNSVIGYTSKVYPATETDIWAVRDTKNSDTLIYHSSNKGNTWFASYITSPNDTIKADVNTHGIFNLGEDSLCILTNAGILRTTDKGKSWSLHSQVLSYLSNLRTGSDKFLFACFSKHIWLGTSGKVMRSDDYGQTWRVVAALDTSTYFSLKSFKALNDSIAYILLSHFIPFEGTKNSYLRTNDAGETWETYVSDVESQSSSLFTTLFADGTGYGIFSPSYTNEYFMAQHLYKTTDAWRTRSLILARSYEFTYGATFFIDKDYGWAYLDALYRTTNGGIDWVKMPATAETPTFTLDRIYPNPASSGSSATVDFTVNCNQIKSLIVELYDILGKRIYRSVETEFRRGRHAMMLSTHGLPEGIYHVCMNTRNLVQTKSFVVK